MAISNEVVVHHQVGLHARPAALFAKTAAKFSSSISVENLTKGTKPVNAKSVLRILTAGIQMNDRLRIVAEGSDEKAAVDALCLLILTDFEGAE